MSTRIALAGAGWMSAVHAMAAQTLGSPPAVVASRTEARARERAAEYRAAYTTYDRLPDGADVVVVATDPDSHATHALRAAAGGAGAVIEKPLAARLADADLLVQAEEAGARFCYAENLLFAPSVGAANASISMIGQLTNLTARALQARPTWGQYLTRAWGGGAAFDLGAHPIALVLRAAREDPVAVSATLEGAPDIEVDEWARILIEFGSGVVAVVEASWRADVAVWDLQAASASGVVRLDLLPDQSLEHNGEPVRISTPSHTEYPPQLDVFGYREQLRDAIGDFAAGGSTSASTAAFGRQVLEVICAAYASAGADGDWIPLPFAGDRSLTPIQYWRP